MTLRVFSEGPYYDDFDETKGFYRILFKPGVAVQARELTQLQTILQKQIERHGSHIFQDGSMVLGGATTMDKSLHFLRASSTLLNGATPATLVGQMLVGVTSGATAKVIATATEDAYPDGLTLVCKFFAPSDPNTVPPTYFTAGETLMYKPDPNVAGTNEVTLISTAYVYQGACSAFSITEGVFYTRGNFVYCPQQTKIIAQDVYDGSGNVLYDGSLPSGRCGLAVTESIVDSDLDTTLLDPSLGSYNYNAPGADRYAIALDLTVKPLLKQAVATVGVDSGTGGLTTFTIVNGGSGYPTVNYNTVSVSISGGVGFGGTAVISGVDQYTGAVTSIIRTAAGSGYTANTVKATVAVPTEADDKFIELSRYDNGILIKNVTDPRYSIIGDTMARRTYDESGDYALNPFKVRMSESALGSDYFTANIDPGKAYVKGYEQTLVGTTKLDILRARDTDHQKTVENYNINSYYGNYVIVEGASVLKPFIPYDQVGNTAYPKLRLLDTGVTIGTARLAQITTENATTNSWQFHLSDVSITDVAKSFADVTEIQLFADATTTCAVTVPNAVLYGTGSSALLHQLPQRNTKTVSGSLNYAYWIKKTGTSDGAGNMTITDNSGGQFRAVAAAAADMAASYIIFDTSNGYIVPMGDLVNNTGGIVASGVSPTTAVFSGLPEGVPGGAGATATNYTILALIDVQGVTKKDKTINNGIAAGANSETITITAQHIADGYITLAVWDAYKLVSATVGSDNITSRFTLDTGQRDASYEYSRLMLNSGDIMPVAGSSLVVYYDYFYHATTGSFFCVDSYPSYDDIPTYYTKTGSALPLGDVLDFRPNADSSNPPVMPYINTDIEVTYTYYVGRQDRLVLTKHGEVISIEGIPNLSPSPPKPDKNSMTLGIIKIAPYTLDVKKDIKYAAQDNRRYTMRDIGLLEQRVARIEYYNLLSLLEKNSKDMLILDTNGLDRFKNGAVIDSFQGHSISDVTNRDLSCGIDIVNQFMTCTTVVESTVARAVHSTRNNVAVQNRMITLAYSAVPCIVQGMASDHISVNPFNVTAFQGNMVADPASDMWKEQVHLPDVVVNVNGANDQIASADDDGYAAAHAAWEAAPKNQFGVAAFPEPSPPGLTFGEWSSNYDGQFGANRLTDWADIEGHDQDNGLGIWPNADGTQVVATREVSSSSPVFSTTSERSADEIVNTSLIPLMRPLEIVTATSGLMPATRHWPYFDDADIIRYFGRADLIAVEVIDEAMPIPTIKAFEYDDFAQVTQSVTAVNGVSIASGRVVMCRNKTMHVIRDPRSAPFAANGNPLEFRFATRNPNTGEQEFIDYTFTVAEVVPGSRQSLLTDGSATTFALDHDVTSPFSWMDIIVLKVAGGNAIPSTASTAEVVSGTKGDVWRKQHEHQDKGKIEAGKTWQKKDDESQKRKTRKKEPALIDGAVEGATSGGAMTEMAHITDWTLDSPVNGLNIIFTTPPAATDMIYVFFPWMNRTDFQGNIAGTFDVPAATFHTGERVIRFLDNDHDDPRIATSKADYTFSSKGILEQLQATVVNTTVQSGVEINTWTEVVPMWSDPLAESFLIDAKLYPNGLYLDSIDLCFKSKDPALPVMIELRPMVNGYPHSSMHIPGSIVEKDTDQVNITDVLGQDPLPELGFTLDGGLVPSFSDPRTVTNFKFKAPIFLSPNTEYCVVIKSNSDLYRCYIAKAGALQLGTNGQLITGQPYLGSLFLSQNSSTWTADQTSDLMFQLNQCKFVSSGTVEVVPDEWTNDRPFAYDLLWLKVNNIEFDGIASIGYGIKTTGTNGVLDTSFMPFSPKDNVYFDSRKVLDSQSTYIDAITAQTTYTLPYLNCDIDTIDVSLFDTMDGSLEIVQNKNLYTVRDKVAAPAGTKELVWQSAIKPVPDTGQVQKITSNGSAVIKLSLATTDENVSPLLDMAHFALRFIRNETNGGEVYDHSFKLPEETGTNITLDCINIALANGALGELRTWSYAGALKGVYIVNGGSGYTAGAGDVTVTASGGVTAVVHLVVDGSGTITDVTIVNEGSGYPETELVITSATGSGAVVYPVVEQATVGDAASGHVVGWYVGDGGYGYVDGFTAELLRSVGGVQDAIGAGYDVVCTTETSAVGGNCFTRYISRRVTLEEGFDAKDMKVYLAAMKPQNTRVEAYYRVLAADDNTDWSARPWVRMVSTGDVQSLKIGEYKDMEFGTLAGTCAYDGFLSYKMFAVKIVLTAINTASVPRIKDLRCIALATTFA